MDEDASFAAAPCGYVVLDDAGGIVAANPEFHRLVGHRLGTLAGRRDLSSLLSVGGRIYLETHLLPVLEHDAVVREVSLDLVRPDGLRVPVLMNATVSREGGFALRAVFLETRDRHRYEMDLLHATQAAEQARTVATDLAQTLQQTLIPPAPPTIPHLAVAATYRPAGDGAMVGGDFYDIFQLDADTWVVALGDVSGKGASAAAVTSFVRYTIRALAVRYADPAEILVHLDRALHDHATDRYCTLVLARLSRTAGQWTVHVSLAGHPPPLLRTAAGATAELGRYGSAIGLVDRSHFHTVEHQLADEVLTFYTDGVTEARSSVGLYGEQRLAELVAATPHDPDTITHAIAEAVLDFQGGDAADDIAVVAFATRPA